MSKPPPTDSGASGNLAQASGDKQKLWLSALAISQPVLIAMAVAAMMVVGAISYTRMGLDLFPDISLPVAVVRTVYSGADPLEVERSVTQPVEDAVASLNGVQTVRSTTVESVSLVIVEFDLNRDAREAEQQVRSRVDAIRNSLPREVQEPVVERFDPSAAPVLALALSDQSGQRSAEETRALAAEVLKPRLEQAPGVAVVDVRGGPAREVHVDLRRAELEAHRVSPLQVVQAIRAENLDVPAGRVPVNGSEQPLRTVGEVESLAQLGEVPVAQPPQGGVVRVKNLADLRLSYAEAGTRTRLDGRESVVLEVRKQSGANTVQVADAVRGEARRLEQEYPGLVFATAFDQATFTREAVQDVQSSLVLGALLAALVVLAFFRDLRNTFVTVAGLPVIVLGTFACLHLLGITLNMISLMALSLSVGLLIDDAIVVRENIFRHMQAGQEPKEAAQRGTAEIALAVLAVSSTIVAVFLPVAFVGGLAGKFLHDFGVTIAVAVLVSLVEAFTLAPMLSAHLFAQPAPPRAGRAHPLLRLDGGYRWLLAWSLSHRAAVALISVLALAGSAALVPRLVFSFAPETDQGQFGISVERPPGTPLEETERVARAAEAMLLAAPEVAHVFLTVGAEGSPEKATLSVQLGQRGHTQQVIARLRPELEQALEGARYAVEARSTQAMLGGGSAIGAVRGRPIQFAVQGEDLAALDRASAEVVARLRQVPGVVDVERSLSEEKPAQTIVLDRQRASEQGVTAAQAGATVRALVNGERAGRLRVGSEQVDILVRLAQADRGSPGDVLRVPIIATRGTLVPLADVARLVESSEPPQISRENRQRQVVVGAGSLGRNPGVALADARAAVAAMDLPEGVTAKATGQARYMDEMFASLGLALALAVLFVYMILASQFGSLVHPLIIMLALPFSLVGALLALFAAGLNFDMLGMLGLILLMGLVTKNSILLVEFINQLRRRGLGVREAILEAGPIRLRPILMTTAAMIFGMLPVALGLGVGAELRQPMGVSVIGGLVTSTLLTLVAVPVAYSLIHDLGRWLARCLSATTHAARGARRLSLPWRWVGMGTALTLVGGVALARGVGLDPASLRPSPGVATPEVASAVAQHPPTSAAAPAVGPTSSEVVALEAIPPQTAPPAGPAASASRPPAPPLPTAVPARPAPAGQVIGNTGGLGANLRATPGTEAKVLAALPEGTSLDPLDRATDAGGRGWLKVRAPRGAIGWVAEEYVKRKT